MSLNKAMSPKKLVLRRVIHPFESSFSAMYISLGGCWSQTWTRGRLGQRHSQPRRAKGKKLLPATHKPKSKSYGQKDLNSTHESCLQNNHCLLEAGIPGMPGWGEEAGTDGSHFRPERVRGMQ